MFKYYKSFYSLQKSKWNNKNKHKLFKKLLNMLIIDSEEKQQKIINTWANKNKGLKVSYPKFFLRHSSICSYYVLKSN